MHAVEERVIIPGEGDNKIGATISYADNSKKRPLVLLIMGTGKLDRDGNGFGFKSNLYKDLSDIFVKMGYVTIRYDKRGTHESTGSLKTAGLSDLVKDSAHVIEYAKTLPYVDEERIVACGHSEGAMIATLLTQQEDLDKIILLGGACMCLKSAMEYQNFKIINEFENKGGLLGWFLRKTISKEKVASQLSSLYEKANNAKGDTFFFRGAMLPAKWLQEHGALTDDDYIRMIEEYSGQVLAITGKADLQADHTYLDRISEFENVATYAPETMNHMLKDIGEDKNSILTMKQQYKKLIPAPIHEGMQTQIEDFMKK